ncbi:AbfB domain-containing protein [Streptomyces dysideae]|uniref:Alpha-L-arabinofuranosidase n=1 Tax=Streptomyces dysideae TaxID=909626 RepID=A0A101V546_9ACTN|nr:AbfB domain-containing protein [Streptomyces dysideae]KUO22677.1 alpha-L-arabinofuranosidase [Streptomyces dysideae]
MPDNKPRPAEDQPWENGWTPDTSRAPGTRRLWLAGTMAVATVVACVTAIAVTDKAADDRSGAGAAANTTGPGLISFATPSETEAVPPKGKSALPTERATTTEPRQHGTSPSPAAEPSKSPSTEPGSPTPKPPAVNWKSVRSVNYPDRYWQVSGSYVKLAPTASAFKLVKGLADTSCYSFATTDGAYLRHREFLLRADRNDGSSLFKKDATFCPRTSPHSGATMLESVNYPGRYLRHQNFQIRLDPYQHSELFISDSTFWLVDGAA